MSAAFWFMVAVLGAACFAFVAVVVWLGERTKEREMYYRNETVKKIAESGHSDAAMEYLREVEKVDQARTRVKARIAGLITLGMGAALMIFLYKVAPGTFVYLVGLIPLLVGVSLLIASEFFLKPAKAG